MFANKSFWLWRSTQGLGTVEREQSSVAWPEWTFGARVLFAFDYFGLFVLSGSRCCSRGAFNRGLAGEMASCPGSTAWSF